MARTDRGLPIARFLMVASSLAPLFLLWAVRGAGAIPDRFWVPGCLLFAIIPNLALLLRWQVAKCRNDQRAIVCETAQDQSDHLLVYLFAMLLPLYTVDLAELRDLFAVGAAFVFIVFLFWHMNLHYMNIAFAITGYRVYTVLMKSPLASPARSVVLLSKRDMPPPAGESMDALRLSDTVFVEKV